jgi:hypothetical protein
MATYTWKGTISSDWGTSGNWSPASPAGGPTIADDVLFDATSLACSTGTTARNAKTINFTGYTNTLTFGNNGNITVAGNITFSSGMTIPSTDSGFIISATSIITTNNFIINCGISSSTASITITFADNVIFARTVDFRVNITINFNGNVILQNTAGTSLLFGAAGQTINLGGSFTCNRNFNNTNASATGMTIKSNSAGVQRKLTIPQEYSITLDYINFTDIDALDGKSIWCYGSTISNCKNIFSLPFIPPTISSPA